MIHYVGPEYFIIDEDEPKSHHIFHKYQYKNIQV